MLVIINIFINMGRFKNIFNLKKIKGCIAISFLSIQNSLITLLLLEDDFHLL